MSQPAALRLRAAPDPRPPCRQWRADLLPPDRPLSVPGDGDRGSLEQPNGRSPSPHPQVPEPDRAVRSWSSSLAQAIVQVVQGLRPLAQLTRWVDEGVLAELALRRRQHSRNLGRSPAAPGRAPVVRSLRLQQPAPHSTEVCAHLLLGPRSVVLAFRLEKIGDRWLCTALELGPLISAAQQ